VLAPIEIVFPCNNGLELKLGVKLNQLIMAARSEIMDICAMNPMTVFTFICACETELVHQC